MNYGRSDEDWDTLEAATRAFLIERAELETLTTYTELVKVLHRRTGLRSFDTDRADERAALGYLLGRVSERSVAETASDGGGRVMLSALVKYLNENDAGTGFYGLAAQLGLFPEHSSPRERLDFWQGQVGKAHARFGHPKNAVK